MKRPVKEFFSYLLYLTALLCWKLLRLMPRRLIRWNCRLIGGGIFLYPPARKLIVANILAAMPETSKDEAVRIGRASCFNMIYNLAEFFWLSGNPRRIEQCYFISDEVVGNLRSVIEPGGRIIFVNPHLGSWEASGLMAPYFAGVRMAAIAKPLNNKYLNRLLNSGVREREQGLKIIFARGAMKASIKALTDGLSLGTLIDQNTRVRDGGIFVDFFGLPVPSSKAPATLARYCDAHGIPARIIYGTSVRLADGRVHAQMSFLAKPIGEYAGDEEIIQELMDISERFIRQYPEQYIWMYRRFWYIPPDCPDAIRRRYPFYGKIANRRFFRWQDRPTD